MKFKKTNKKKQVFKNIKYENINIYTKKRRFSKIEVDPYVLEEIRDKRPLLMRLKEYFYSTFKEIHIIKWQKLKETWKDFKIVFWFVVGFSIIFVIVELIFVILRFKGVI